MSNELISIADTRELGGILVKSGFFEDVKQEAQAIVKVLAGRELGFGPIAAMTGIYIVKGRIAMGANLIAAAIKRHPHYDFRVRKLADTECTIEFFQDGQACGMSTFTAQDATRAGTQNMGKFPRNMLYARAMTNGARWYCPDVFSSGIYTPDELGATIDAEGDVIDVTPTVTNTITDAEFAALPVSPHSGQAAPQPKPEPEPTKKLRPAGIVGILGEFNEWSAEFAEQYPAWQTTEGLADRLHILFSIAKLGHQTVTADNWEQVKSEMVDRAEARAA